MYTKKEKKSYTDYLSWNIVNAISFEGQELKEERKMTPSSKPSRPTFFTKSYPKTPSVKVWSSISAPNIYKRLMSNGEESKEVMNQVKLSSSSPQPLSQIFIADAHGELMSGHDGVLET